MARAPSTKSSEKKVSIADFHKMLVLAEWALSFFATDFERLSAALKNRPQLEGIDPQSRNTFFFAELTNNLFNIERCPAAVWRTYDQRIVGYWREITERRNAEAGTELKMKYFQYLSLLVTELYLDWYFNRREQLLAELNRKIAVYNVGKNKVLTLDPIADASALNKISFWEATGAGKTLLMHVNIKQYLHYAANTPPDRILVLTPNEGLSLQHEKELHDSGFSAGMFIEGDLPERGKIYLLDANKLLSGEGKKKKGKDANAKTVMAECFEGNNLVLVDEGHHGQSGDSEHRRARDMVCKDGFSFEYSATFGQAVAGSGKGEAELRQIYGKSILFDYSYVYFHRDGYGKEAFIMNLEKDGNARQVFEYQVANLLAFYQQHWLYKNHQAEMASFGIEKPLCLFVGTTVTTEDSDVLQVLKFLGTVLNERERVEKILSALIKNETVVAAGNGQNALHDFFLPLLNQKAEDVYDDILKTIFNSEHVARMRVQPIAATGEIVLSVGLSKPFGLVHIGASGDFVKLCEKEAAIFDTLPSDGFSESIFAKIGKKNDKDGEAISYLIGAKKFMEGWSSWRVSTIGLLNVGQSEGTQIIQLFGRGVRLKGRNFSLKRSTAEERRSVRNAHVERLEQLIVFGIRADYMETFRKYLAEDGISTQDQITEIKIPIRHNAFPKNLKVLRVKDGYRLNQKDGFKTQALTLFEVPEGMEKRAKHIVVDYDDYSYLQTMRTDRQDDSDDGGDSRGSIKLDARAFNFFDWDGIYRELLTYKAEKGYWNLALEKKRLVDFVKGETEWYRLNARAVDYGLTSLKNVAANEKMLLTLLKLYADKFYKTFQSVYEDEHKEQVAFDSSVIPEEYTFQLENKEGAEEWKQKLEILREFLSREEIPVREINQWSTADFVALTFKQHLFVPLFYTRKGAILPFVVKPMGLVESEKRFVEDLQAFYEDEVNAAFFKGKDLFLMRNAANKKYGLGFAQAGGFFPDFLLWILDKKAGTQSLTFVDPKGLRNISEDDPKLNFSEEVKVLEAAINKDKPENEYLTLNSFIVTETPYLETGYRATQAQLAERNILFMEGLSPTGNYIRTLLQKITA